MAGHDERLHLGRETNLVGPDLPLVSPCPVDLIAIGGIKERRVSDN
jgi:hypothetical protein